MLRPPVSLIAALVAGCAALPLAGCANDRAAGAGDLTVTSRAATSKPTTTAPARKSGTATRRRSTATRTRTVAARTSAAHTRAHPIRFARVALRGTDHTLTIPRGWRAELWAHVDGARFESFIPAGTLLVSSPTQGTITELAARHGRAPAQRTIASGLTNPQGMAFDHLHGREYLYVADSDALLRYRWTTQGTLADRRTLVNDLPDTEPAGDDVHRYKDVVVARDHTIFIDIGSSSNATIPAPVPKGTLPRASVVAFHPDGSLDRIWATGVRNGDGLAIAPDGSLWVAVNERDQIPYPFHRSYDGSADAYGQIIPAYVDNHPPDEVAKLTPARTLGWPYCDPDPDGGSPGHPTLHYGDLPFTDDVQTNPHGDRLDCAHLQPLQRGLPAHSAPLGLTFLEGSHLPRRWADGAVVAGHGSWDRQPPRPPVVYWMGWNARTHTLGRAVTLISGFQAADGSRWGRLADAIPGPDGSLYVTDDLSGAVYRITP